MILSLYKKLSKFAVSKCNKAIISMSVALGTIIMKETNLINYGNAIQVINSTVRIVLTVAH